MHRSFRQAAALVGLLAGLGSSSFEAAASEADARTLFAEGRVARTAGDCDRAIGLFQKALELSPTGIGSLRNIAECEEELGRFAEARRSYWDLRVAALKSGDVRYDGWSEWAEEAHARLATQVARMTIEVEGLGERKATLLVDGKPLDPRLWGTELERDPGSHVIRLEYGGAEPSTRTVTLKKGGLEAVVLRVPAPAPEVAMPAPSTPPAASSGATEAPTAPPPPDQTTGDAMRGAAVASFAIAGLGLVGAGISLGVRQGALSDVEGMCPAYETEPCGPNVADARDRGETASLLVNVMLGVTVVGAGAGLALWLSSDDDSGAVAIGVDPARSGLGPTARWRF